MSDELMNAQADELITGKYIGDWKELKECYDSLNRRKSDLKTDKREMTDLLKKRKIRKDKRHKLDYYMHQKEQFNINIEPYELELKVFEKRFHNLDGLVGIVLGEMVEDMLRNIKQIRTKYDLIISGYTRLTT